MQELTEETMSWVWPNIDEEGRGWVIAMGSKLRQAEDRLLKRIAREHEEGLIPASEQVQEHIKRGVGAMWHDIAVDLSHRLGCSENEAKRFVEQPAIRIYSSEFAEALGNQKDDEYGWTLDEHFSLLEMSVN